MWALTLFVVVLLLQAYFYLYLFNRFVVFKKESRSDSTPFVSVVICAKNEEAALKENLQLILEQKYPFYEVVLVDDGSTDQSRRVMISFKEKFENSERKIKVISIPASESKGKKKALARGIDKAGGQVLLMTDADCRPTSNMWIHEMVQNIPREKGMVLGYGPYRKIKGSLLNKLIRFETLMTAVQYFSFALEGRAYMGVGRNMAYHKDLYVRADGFQSHEQILSGDDDLFVNQVASWATIRICTRPDSFMVSEPKKELGAWIRQKQRHITTAAHYHLYHRLSLGLYYLSQLSFYGLSFILLAKWNEPFVILGLILCRFVIFYKVILKCATRLGEKDLVCLAPWYEFSIIFIQLYIFFKNIIAPPKQW